MSRKARKTGYRGFRNRAQALHARQAQAPALEGLEERMLLSLVGVAPAYPRVNYDSAGTLAYASDTGRFDVSTTALTFTQSGSTPPVRLVLAPGSLQLHLQLDSAGNLVGGVVGDDLTLSGTLQNGSYSGLLLTGEVSQFGFFDSGTTTDQFDFRFRVTGGALASLFTVAGQDIGITLSAEESTFVNTFAASFAATIPKGDLGGIPAKSTLKIELEKDTNGQDADNPPGPLVKVGDPITWTYIVSNPGDVPLSNVSVSDSHPTVVPHYQSGDLNKDSILQTTEVWTYTATGVAAAGQYENIGTVLAYSGATPATASDSSHYFGVQPGIQIVKLTNGTDNNSLTGPRVAVGSTVTWTYDVTNPGNVPLSGVTVTDDRTVVAPVFTGGDTNGNGRLDPGEMWVYTATGTAVAGQYSNLGTATGTDYTGTVTAPVVSSDVDHYFGVKPGIKLVKLTNGTDNNNLTGPQVVVGSTVTWTYDVTNPGNVALSGVLVTDDRTGVSPVFASGDTNNDGLLNPGEMWVYTATGTAVAGQYSNLGTATGADSTGTVTAPVTSTDVDHYFGVQPDIQLVKRTNGIDSNDPTGALVAVGSTVTWTYAVTNPGNVPLSGVIVTDDRTGVTPVFVSGDANNNGRLDPGETWLYTATGIAVAGQYANLGTATGTDYTGTAAAPVTSTDLDHYFGVLTGIQIVKLTNGTDNNAPTGPLVAVGSTVTWTYSVINQGNVAIAAVRVTDNQAGVTPVLSGGDANGDGLLDPDEMWVYTATGTAVAGQYSNLGTATGTDATGTVTAPVTSSDVDHYFGVKPGIAIEKLTNGQDVDSGPGPILVKGDPVTWTYLVTNTGNVPLSQLSVVDSQGVVPVYQSGDANLDGLLQTDETWVFTAVGTVVAGAYANTGTATGSDVLGEQVSASDTEHYQGIAPAIDIRKLVSAVTTAGGEGLTPGFWKQCQHFCAWNGYSPSQNYNAVFGVQDDPRLTLLGALSRGGGGVNALGRHAVAALLNSSHSNISYAYTAAQIIAMVRGAYAAGTFESVKNLFAAQNELGANLCSGGSGATLSTPIDANEAPGLVVPPGTLLQFSYQVTNPGDTALMPVTVKDDNATPAVPTDDFAPTPVLSGGFNVGDLNHNNRLEPGETWQYTAQGVSDSGQHVNTAVATGTPISQSGAVIGSPVTDSDVAYWGGMSKQAGIVIDKQGPTIAHAGGSLNYTYVVSNVGEVSLSQVGVLDDKAGQARYVSGDTNGNALLDLDEQWTFTATVTAASTRSDTLTNIAVATGHYGTVTVTDSDSYTLHAFTIHKALYLYWDGGSCKSVAYTVADGTAFTVQASKDGAVVDTFTVAANTTQKLWLADGTFTFTEVNLPAGYLNASGALTYTTGQCGNDRTFVNVATYDLAVQKTGPATAAVGDEITYTYTVTNSGPAQVKPVLVDNQTGTPDYVSGDTDHDGLVDTNETWTFMSDYRVGACMAGKAITNIVTVDDAANPHSCQAILGGDVNKANNTASWTVQVASSGCGTGSLAGMVWVDDNDDGQVDFGEDGLRGVKVELTGRNDLGQTVDIIDWTDDSGEYAFDNLRPGRYTIHEYQPSAYRDGQDVAGTLGIVAGTIANDSFTVDVISGAKGVNYNFGELPVDCNVHCGQSATIGFWKNKNGQALLKSLNGSPNSTRLGNWLATTFPNLYGANAGENNLAGKTNAQIACLFQKLFNVCGQKLDAQVLAVAFGAYVTDVDLAGTTASRYGFSVTDHGLGAAKYNIGAAGAAFGVANYTTLTVIQILQATDDHAASGSLWAGNTVLRNMANTVFDGINNASDIC